MSQQTLVIIIIVLAALLPVTFFSGIIYARVMRRRRFQRALAEYEKELAHAMNTPIVTERSIVELGWLRAKLRLPMEKLRPLHEKYVLKWEARYITPDSITGEEREIARRLRRELEVHPRPEAEFGSFY